MLSPPEGVGMWAPLPPPDGPSTSLWDRSHVALRSADTHDLARLRVGPLLAVVGVCGASPFFGESGGSAASSKGGMQSSHCARWITP